VAPNHELWQVAAVVDAVCDVAGGLPSLEGDALRGGDLDGEIEVEDECMSLMDEEVRAMT
jgi:hypothetical protein